MIDWAHLYGLRADVGGEVFVEVVGLFLIEADATIAALSAPDTDTALLLHKLKGSALAMGLSALASSCRDGERRANAGAMPDIATTLHVYSESKTELCDGLRKVNILPAA